MDAGLQRALLDVLEDARGRGFLGPSPVTEQLDIALAMGDVVHRVLATGRRAVPPDDAGAQRDAVPELEVLDLGAGGGVPGLVIAAVWPRDVRWTLLDAHQRRVRFLAGAVQRLGLDDRVEVVGERAEVVGRNPSHRERYAAVVARSFGSPAATAEMATALVRPGGAVLVSEPPGSAGDRWPIGPLRELGLVRRRVHEGVPAVMELGRDHPCPGWAPRRTGVPAKRPLF